MKAAVLAATAEATAFISAAAPADYRPAQVADRKIKKGEKLALELEPTDDILLSVNEQARPQVLVGFAANRRCGEHCASEAGPQAPRPPGRERCRRSRQRVRRDTNA